MTRPLPRESRREGCAAQHPGQECWEGCADSDTCEVGRWPATQSAFFFQADPINHTYWTAFRRNTRRRAEAKRVREAKIEAYMRGDHYDPDSSPLR